jgi:hypothetical protein
MSTNAGPATMTTTAIIGNGVAATAIKFTDVQDLDVDFMHNTIKITRAAGVIETYDYYGMNTMTWTISGGATTITITS